MTSTFLKISLIMLGCLGTQTTFSCDKIVKKLGRLKVQCMLDQPIGTGSYGAVFLVRDLQQQERALKYVPQDPKADWKTKYAAHEAELLSKCVGCKNVIQYVDSEIQKHGVFILMEFAHYGNLYHFRKKYPELFRNPYWIFWLVREIAKGIREIHKLGHIVYDLKTDNVVLASGFLPKIIDLGLSRPLGQPSFPGQVTLPFTDIRLQDAILKKPFLSEPGQTVTAPPFDPSFDIHALGVTILWLIVDPVPKMALNIEDLKQGLHLLPIEIPAGTEVGVAEIVNWCLLADAAKRPTVDELIAKAEEGLEVGDHSVYRFVEETTSFRNKKLIGLDFESATLKPEPRVGFKIEFDAMLEAVRANWKSQKDELGEPSKLNVLKSFSELPGKIKNFLSGSKNGDRKLLVRGPLESKESKSSTTSVSATSDPRPHRHISILSGVVWGAVLLFSAGWWLLRLISTTSIFQKEHQDDGVQKEGVAKELTIESEVNSTPLQSCP